MTPNPQAVSAAQPRQRAMATGSLHSGQPAASPPSSGEPGARTFFLKPCRPPRAERSFGRLPAGTSGTHDALAAASAGDRKHADALEIWWLNTWGPRPTIEQLLGEPNDDLGVIAESLLHEPGGMLIEWSVVRVDCWRCFRRLRPPQRCRRCDGHGAGYDPFGDALTFYTDVDLNLEDLS